jgi:DNA-binding MarR family transcriptional regulator
MDVTTGLVRLSFLIQEIYARVSERHDLTPVQAKLLCVVADGPRGMADLANHFGVERAALTGLVDRVERRGLAERTAVPGDRRALHVAPTETGCQAAFAFKAEIEQELRALVADLSPELGEHLREALAQIVGAHPQGCPRGPC